MASLEMERSSDEPAAAGASAVELKTMVMKNTKRTLDMFVRQEGAPPPAFMARSATFCICYISPFRGSVCRRTTTRLALSGRALCAEQNATQFKVVCPTCICDSWYTNLGHQHQALQPNREMTH